MMELGLISTAKVVHFVFAEFFNIFVYTASDSILSLSNSIFLKITDL